MFLFRMQAYRCLPCFSSGADDRCDPTTFFRECGLHVCLSQRFTDRTGALPKGNHQVEPFAWSCYQHIVLHRQLSKTTPWDPHLTSLLICAASIIRSSLCTRAVPGVPQTNYQMVQPWCWLLVGHLQAVSFVDFGGAYRLCAFICERCAVQLSTRGLRRS